jgi:exopolysaccharide biosynthesis polyprenyl glycosylphosphotransferase
MNKTRLTIKYLIFDILSAAASWTLFFLFRKIFIESRHFGYAVDIRFNERYLLGLILITAFWCLLFFMAGFYRDVYRKSRLREFGTSLLVTLIGTVILFFSLLLNDIIASYKSYYASFSVLFLIQFLLSYLPRMIITSQTIRKIRKGSIGFRTLIIGANGKALEIYREITRQPVPSGNQIIGFVPMQPGDPSLLANHIPHLGAMENLDRILKEQQVEEVIVAIESTEDKDLERILNILEGYDVIVKIIPSLYDILTGKVAFTNIYGTPLIQVSREIMPPWQATLKRTLDVGLSLLALILSIPLILVLCLLIMLGSSGPVIYSQERIGRHGRQFRIFKFRTMINEAEKNGPRLSSRDDPRVTSIGRFMRRTRMDEIPNFINVIRGEMSLVGPRPERKFYIDQILSKAPHYIHLQKVKPGITSWGQVKFGYAENVEQMIQRMQYDLIYIENMSLAVDLKIMIYTLITILKGRGI